MESAKVYPLNGNRLERSRPLSAPTIAPRPKLLDQVRQAIGKHHYSDRTEKAYVHWIKRFIFFHNKRHPLDWPSLRSPNFFRVWLRKDM